MLQYLAKRLLYFIPTLFGISLITFILSISAPGDPVEAMLNRNSGEERQSDRIAQEHSYEELRHKLGLDLPVFYFSVGSAASCDSIYKISNLSHRAALERMVFTYGNRHEVARYYLALKNLESALCCPDKNDPAGFLKMKSAQEILNSLYIEYDSLRIRAALSAMQGSFENNESLKPAYPAYLNLKNSFVSLLRNQEVYKRYIPALHWFGFNNQYHRWLQHFVCGDFGTSYQDKRPVSSVIWDALGWTLTLSLLSALLAYLIAIPLGVMSAVGKGSFKEKVLTSALFMLYSLPNFWIATLAVIFLCGGDWFSWFPSPGADWPSAEASTGEWLSAAMYRLILPLICWTYGSFAFISRQMRGGILSVLGQDFIRTARAKGLKERQVIWKHAFRNSLLPVITLFANVFPLAIGGSFVIEYIFSIPGMGKLSLEALLSRNYPVIFTVMMFTSILTLVGNLVADILYAFADPRISFTHKRT